MYKYLLKKEVKKYRTPFTKIILEAHQEIIKKIKIKAMIYSVGSAGNGLVTMDSSGKFDYDYNVEIIKIPKRYKNNLKGLKEELIGVFDKYFTKAGFDHRRDSTAAIRYRKENYPASIDIGIVTKIKGNYNRLVRKNGVYIWNEIPDSGNVLEKSKIIRKSNHWKDLKEVYLSKKNVYEKENEEEKHPSFIVFNEAVNQVYYKNIDQGGKAMAKVSGNTHTQAQMNHHSNQSNPNNAAHQAANNNHANQCNPNNSAYKGSKK